MIKYNICFVRRGDEVLLLNRNPALDGVLEWRGGKLEANETRETRWYVSWRKRHIYKIESNL